MWYHCKISIDYYLCISVGYKYEENPGVGRDYLRTAPLHPSQREEFYSDEASDFTLHCRTTRDLLLHLLSQGSDIEVLEPADFRMQVETEAQRIAERYK